MLKGRGGAHWCNRGDWSISIRWTYAPVNQNHDVLNFKYELCWLKVKWQNSVKKITKWLYFHLYIVIVLNLEWAVSFIILVTYTHMKISSLFTQFFQFSIAWCKKWSIDCADVFTKYAHRMSGSSQIHICRHHIQLCGDVFSHFYVWSIFLFAIAVCTYFLKKCIQHCYL